MFSCVCALQSFPKLMESYEESFFKYQENKKSKNQLDELKIKYSRHVLYEIREFLYDLEAKKLISHFAKLSKYKKGQEKFLDEYNNIRSALEIFNIVFHVLYSLIERYKTKKKEYLTNKNIINRMVHMDGVFDILTTDLLLALSEAKNEIDSFYMLSDWKNKQEILVNVFSV